MRAVYCGLGIGLTLIAMTGVSAYQFKECAEKEDMVAEMECRRSVYAMRVSEGHDICGNYVRYNGIVSEKRFGIHSSVHDSVYGQDLFFPAEKKREFNVRGYNFRVEDVSPERLILTYHGNNR